MGVSGVARTPHVWALFICTTRNPNVCTAARQRGLREHRHHTLPLAARPLKQNLWAPTSIAGFPLLLKQYRNCPGKQGNGNGRPSVGGGSGAGVPATNYPVVNIRVRRLRVEQNKLPFIITNK